MRRRILFVDDDQDILDSFRTMLHFKRKKWKCYFATNATEGLKILDDSRIDVVITDMRMPGMDGAEFLREVEKRQPGTARMILSGYSDMQLLLRSVKHAHQFLSKPCSSETVVDAIRRVTELRYILEDGAVRSMVTGLDSLPVIPDLYLQLTKELQVPEPDISRIGSLVEKDVGMSATLMRVVNSSFFGFYETVSSPTRAVTLLGLEPLKGLVLGEHLLKKINLDDFPGYSVSKLWKHSLQTGYFAKAIAAMESEDKELMEDCFISGVLHDVGKLVLATKFTEDYTRVLKLTREVGGPVGRHEQEVFGVTHAKVGAYLLGLWGFRPSVVEAVFGHHEPKSCIKAGLATLIVHAANVLQHELKGSSGYLISTLDMECLEEAGLSGRLDAWREACKQHLEQGDEG